MFDFLIWECEWDRTPVGLGRGQTPSGLRPSPPPRGGEPAETPSLVSGEARASQSLPVFPLVEGEMGEAQKGSVPYQRMRRSNVNRSRLA